MGDHDKNRSYNALTEGTSASSAVAVGLVAAWRGDHIKSDVALTGKIMSDGQIEFVDALVVKAEATTRARFKLYWCLEDNYTQPTGTSPSWQPDGISTSLKSQRWRRPIRS